MIWHMGAAAGGRNIGASASVCAQCGGTFLVTGAYCNRLWTQGANLRTNGVGELYTYLPMTEHNAAQQRKVPPQSVENSDYGFSVGRGAFDFKAAVGNWIAIATRVKLNDVGCENGEVEVWIDGESVIFIDGLVLREQADSTIRGMQFQTFFGGEFNASISPSDVSSCATISGHTPEWASPKDQRAWFADVTGAIMA